MPHPQPLPSTPTRLVRSLRSLAAVCLLASAIGCATSGSPSASNLPPGAVVLPYDAYGAHLFGDVIEPSAVGLLTAAPSPQARQLLGERTRQAHVVTRVRVQTVTADVIHGQPRYQLVLAEIGPSLTRSGLPGGRVELEVWPQTPAFGIVKANDTRLVGKSFLGFFRWFRAGEEPRIHWHLASDDPETIDAAREAALVPAS